jgi:hypothetical protein
MGRRIALAGLSGCQALDLAVRPRPVLYGARGTDTRGFGVMVLRVSRRDSWLAARTGNWSNGNCSPTNPSGATMSRTIQPNGLACRNVPE